MPKIPGMCYRLALLCGERGAVTYVNDATEFTLWLDPSIPVLDVGSHIGWGVSRTNS